MGWILMEWGFIWRVYVRRSVNQTQVCWKTVPERIMVGCRKGEDGRELGKKEKEFRVFAVVKHGISPVFSFGTVMSCICMLNSYMYMVCRVPPVVTFLTCIYEVHGLDLSGDTAYPEWCKWFFSVPSANVRIGP